MSEIISAILGAMLGVWLTRGVERRNWTREQARLEFREVLDAFNQFHDLAVAYIARYDVPLWVGSTAEQQTDRTTLINAMNAVSRVLRDRLFIRECISRSGIPADFDDFLRSWDEVPGDFLRRPIAAQASRRLAGVAGATRALTAIREKIIAAAKHEIGIPD